jgi:hypothetical protein
MDYSWKDVQRSSLNGSSRNQRDVATAYKKNILPKKWKGYGVVLERIFYPEPLLIMVLKTWIQGVYSSLNERGMV